MATWPGSASMPLHLKWHQTSLIICLHFMAKGMGFIATCYKNTIVIVILHN